jgi:probable phosphoglycerate mutase
MPTFFLIRHGDNNTLGKKLAGRMPGVHLNEKGISQANQLAVKLGNAPIKVIYASPLERAQETASPIAQQLILEIKTQPSLIEVDFGDWEGKSLKQLKRTKLWKQVQQNPGTFQFPGGERLIDAQQRVVDGLIKLSQEYQDEDLVICVSHSDPIRLAVAHFLGMPLDHLQRLRIAPASITALVLRQDGTVYFEFINQTIADLQLGE